MSSGPGGFGLTELGSASFSGMQLRSAVVLSRLQSGSKSATGIATGAWLVGLDPNHEFAVFDQSTWNLNSSSLSWPAVLLFRNCMKKFGSHPLNWGAWQPGGRVVPSMSEGSW